MTKEELILKYPERFKDVYSGFDCGPGWISLLDDCFKEMDEECLRTGASYSVAQIKEKFGGLRVYIDVSGTDNNLFNIEHKYENRSFSVCENCGLPGKLGGRGWVRTLCDVCVTLK